MTLGLLQPKTEFKFFIFHFIDNFQNMKSTDEIRSFWMGIHLPRVKIFSVYILHLNRWLFDILYLSNLL